MKYIVSRNEMMKWTSLRTFECGFVMKSRKRGREREREREGETFKSNAWRERDGETVRWAMIAKKETRKSLRRRVLKITIAGNGNPCAPLSPPNIEDRPSKARRGAVNSKAIRRTRRGKGVDLQLTTTRGSRRSLRFAGDRGKGAREKGAEKLN